MPDLNYMIKEANQYFMKPRHRIRISLRKYLGLKIHSEGLKKPVKC